MIGASFLTQLKVLHMSMHVVWVVVSGHHGGHHGYQHNSQSLWHTHITLHDKSVICVTLDIYVTCA